MTSVLTIIPTLNAAASLEGCLEALSEGERTRLNEGWVVVDGGSADATLEIARRSGCLTVTGTRGRGAQLALGAEAALRASPDADWLMFLHADTRLESGWSYAVRQFCERYQGYERAGYFRFALDDVSSRARRLETAVNCRSRALKLPYGDQGLLISKTLYQALGGYKPWPLFEDVDLVRRIGRSRLKPISARAVTSAERFTREGYLRRSTRNFWLLSRYYLGADVATLARAYQS